MKHEMILKVLQALNGMQLKETEIILIGIPSNSIINSCLWLCFIFIDMSTEFALFLSIICCKNIL